MAKYVRIHPADKRHTRKSHTASTGHMFYEGRGWTKVDDKLAAELAAETMDPYDKDSNLVFQVLTEEEYRRQYNQEREKLAAAAVASMPALEATDITTKPAESPDFVVAKRRGRPAKIKPPEGVLTASDVNGTPEDEDEDE